VNVGSSVADIVKDGVSEDECVADNVFVMGTCVLVEVPDNESVCNDDVRVRIGEFVTVGAGDVEGVSRADAFRVCVPVGDTDM
jgi:hypothetical protein